MIALDRCDPLWVTSAQLRRSCNREFIERQLEFPVFKTAAGILHDEDSSGSNDSRVYRTRKDPLEPFWMGIEGLLKNDPKLKAYILLEEMLRRHPTDFLATWKRTLERRVRDWKLEHRVEQEVFFDQQHIAGDVMAFDFTHMKST
jgi:hypothetical protein